jgi:Cof subfamily protein (haloacid dehalogenase superfamily)
MTYQLAAIDLDGTLLHSKTHDITPTNAAAVRQAADSGAIIVLASGRQWATIDVFAGKIGLPPDAPIIAYNGAMIRTHGGETWFHVPVPAAPSEQIVHFCAQGGYHLNYYLDDVLYIKEETHWSRLYEQRTGTEAHVTGDLGLMDGREPTKLLLIDTPETTDRLLARFQAEFGSSLYITKTDDEYLEFMQAGVSKGVALAHVARRLGIDATRCVAFGDSFNDIPMLEWAGLGVAMDNARPQLKLVAGLIAPPADENGVGQILATLFPVHPEHQGEVRERQRGDQRQIQVDEAADASP